VFPAQSRAEVQSWILYVPDGQVKPAGGALSPVQFAAHDDVIELAVQLGIVPAPVSLSEPQQTGVAPEHSPCSAPPSGATDPAQSSGVPPAGQAPPSGVSHDAV
jgi:hypothetical protein